MWDSDHTRKAHKPPPSASESCRNGDVSHHADQLSSSAIGMAPISCSRINFASSVTAVSGQTQSTPLCIASLTFMADLRCRSLSTLDEMQSHSCSLRLYNGSDPVARGLKVAVAGAGPVRSCWQLFRVVGRDGRVAQVVAESLVRDRATHHSRRQKTPMETLTQQFHSDRTRMDSKGSESLRLNFLHDFAPRLGFEVKRHPRLSRLTRFYDLLAGWKLDSFLLIRFRPRDPVCV
jgi:hypothetical protein